MCGKWPRKGARYADRAAAAAAACAVAASLAAAPARAEGLWDSLLEKMNVKAAPAGPGADFVERTRPDPAGLGYLPTAMPHKVSPLAVKTPAEIQAGKDALDLAKRRQLDPAAGKAPLQIVKAPAAGATGAAGAAAKARPAAAKPAPEPAPVSD